MKQLVSPRLALLQAFYEGPGTCSSLIERLQRLSGGRIRLGQGPTSVTLRKLERDGLVRSWVNAPEKRGRPRRYYELTGQGIAEAHSQREALRGLLGLPAPPGPSLRERRAMAERLTTAVALSDFALTLRDAPRRPLS
jgi:PadR family transcriptional regulator PadR